MALVVRAPKPRSPKFYDIARGSAHECGAVLDASAILKLVDEEHLLRGKTLLVRTVQMLVKMTQ